AFPFLGRLRGPDDLREHVRRLDRVRAHGEDALLRAVEPRAGDHLHGARDLLRALDARDALAQGFQIGQRRLLRFDDGFFAHALDATKLSLKFLSTESSCALMSSVIAFFSRMFFQRSGCFSSIWR